MSDEVLMPKLVAPVIPTMRYMMIQIVIEYEITLCMETVRDNSFMNDGTVVICWDENEQLSYVMINRTYKGKIVEYKTNKSALIATYSRNFLIQTMLGKYYNPDSHDKEEGSCRDKLESDILN